MPLDNTSAKKIAVVGSGISGLSAAWLLSQRHDVVLYEQARRLGGHTNTIDALVGERVHAVDTGFIVYNERNYPNLAALFDHLGVVTRPTDMSFGVSLDGGRREYSSEGVRGLLARPANAFSPRFWSMLRDLARFYRDAPAQSVAHGSLRLGDFLDLFGYGRAFRDDHLLPMAAAIWSAPADTLLAYPAQSFVRFCKNHGLLELSDRPQWRTVVGGSRSYVQKLTDSYSDRVRLGRGVQTILRKPDGVRVFDAAGASERFDEVVVATHADQALALLADPSPSEVELLSAFEYERNVAVLHTDPAFMPRRRAAWSSWNYLGAVPGASNGKLCVSYWMNNLQGIVSDRDLFVTLNPAQSPRARSILHTETYEHPIFDSAANEAQRSLWALQGVNRTWFCGAYFGAGFHEDGLQAGLAVAEALGAVRRPWRVADESGRIFLLPDLARSAAPAARAA